MASECCQQTVDAAPDAVFCGGCGKPILRCMAFSECRGLVNDDGLCLVCVSPQLSLDKGALPNAKAGEALALPLVFANASPINRPLFITHVWTRLGEGERKRQEVDWDRLMPKEQIRTVVQTAPLETTGRIRFDIAFTAATRLSGLFWREEQFAFVSQLELDVEAGGGLVINQTINAAGQGQGSDTIYAPVRIEGGMDSRRREGLGEEMRLGLVQARKLERDIGVRGYAEGALKGAAVSRAARITFKDFAEGEAPKPGPITTPDGIIRMGRANPKSEGGDSDVRLLIFDKDGKVDENVSLAISRRHIDLFIQSGRLCLFAAGEAGVLVNDLRVAKSNRDNTHVLQDGDVIHVLPKFPDQLSLKVRMRANFGVIDEIEVQRIPAQPGDGSR